MRAIEFRLFAGDQMIDGDEALIQEWLSNEDSMLWIDMDSTDPAEEIRLLNQLCPAAGTFLPYWHSPRRPPRFDHHEDVEFLLLKGLDADTSDLEFGTIQLSMIMADRLIITRHSGESRSIQKITRELADGSLKLPLQTPLELTLKIATTVFDRYLPIVLALEERLDTVEDEIFDRPGHDYLEELTGYRTALKRLRRFTAYHKTVMQRFQKRHIDAPEPIKRMFVDGDEALDRLASLQSLFYDMASDLVEGYISMSAHRLNEIMKVLTIVTAIFVPLSFLAGIYGMNFEYIPELNYRWGYFALIGIMATIVATLLVTFRRKRWI